MPLIWVKSKAEKETIWVMTQLLMRRETVPIHYVYWKSDNSYFNNNNEQFKAEAIIQCIQIYKPNAWTDATLFPLYHLRFVDDSSIFNVAD